MELLSRTSYSLGTAEAPHVHGKSLPTQCRQGGIAPSPAALPAAAWLCPQAAACTQT